MARENENDGFDSEEEAVDQIVLDGSFGTLDDAVLTVITSDPIEGEKEKTYIFPFSFINSDMIDKFARAQFILGYKLVRQKKVG